MRVVGFFDVFHFRQRRQEREWDGPWRNYIRNTDYLQGKAVGREVLLFSAAVAYAVS